MEGAATLRIAIELAPGEDRGVAADDGGDPGTGNGQRTVGIVAFSVGIAGVAAGAVLGLTAISTWNRARSDCTGGTTGCSSEALSLEQTTRTEALWSTVAFGVGAAGLVGGALLFLAAPRAERRTGLLVAPTFASDRVSLTLGASF